MWVLPLILIIATLSLFTRAQNTTSDRRTSFEDLAGKCATLPACIDAFDILVICAVPLAPTDPHGVYEDFSHATSSQWQCLCKTRGFLRATVDCLFCHEMDAEGWEYWCTEPSSRQLSTGAIVGIAVAGFVVMLVGGTTYVLYRRSVRRRKDRVSGGAIYGQGTKAELNGVSGDGGTSMGQLVMVGEIDGYERRAELPGHQL